MTIIKKWNGNHKEKLYRIMRILMKIICKSIGWCINVVDDLQVYKDNAFYGRFKRILSSLRVFKRKKINC